MEPTFSQFLQSMREALDDTPERRSLRELAKALGDRRGIDVHTQHHYETGPDGKRRRVVGATPNKAHEFGGHPTPHAMHRASGPDANDNFTHDEMSLPEKGVQHTSDVGDLMHHAARHKEHLDNIIDRGKGLSAKLGFHVVEGRQITHDDIAEGHKKGGMVVLAPLKGANDGGARLRSKVQNDYDGDASKLKDLSRATIAVSHPDDMAHVTHHLRKLGLSHGLRPKDRFEQPTDAGYSDVQTVPRDPHGHLGELQLHSLDMLQAKELGLPGREDLGVGHKHFEEMREMPGHPGKRTPEQQERYEHLAGKSKELYQEARRRMLEREAKLHKRATGNQDKERTVEKTGTSYVKGYYRHPGHSMAKGCAAMKSNKTKVSGYYDLSGDVGRLRADDGSLEVWNGKEWVGTHTARLIHEGTLLSDEKAHAKLGKDKEAALAQ